MKQVFQELEDEMEAHATVERSARRRRSRVLERIKHLAEAHGMTIRRYLDELEHPRPVPEIDQIAAALDLCPTCTEMFRRYSEQHQRSLRLTIREAAGRLLHHWPHWRGCPPREGG